MTSCPRCGRHLAGGDWCTVHGTVVESLVDVRTAVEEPVARRRRDQARRTGAKWTDEDLAKLYAFKDDLSVYELAAELDRTPRGVMNRISSLGWRKKRIAGDPPAPRVVDEQGRAGRRWTAEEDALLLDLPIGVVLSRRVVLFPGRSERAVRLRHARLHGRRSVREADGMLTMVGVARAYRVSRWRVSRLVGEGVLPATKSRSGDWLIDPADCERIVDVLRAPKRTWTADPPDMGDYRRRYCA